MSEMAMFFGESRYIEYKREVPKDSLKWRIVKLSATDYVKLFL